MYIEYCVVKFCLKKHDKIWIIFQNGKLNVTFVEKFIESELQLERIFPPTILCLYHYVCFLKYLSKMSLKAGV